MWIEGSDEDLTGERSQPIIERNIALVPLVPCASRRNNSKETRRRRASSTVATSAVVQQRRRSFFAEVSAQLPDSSQFAAPKQNVGLGQEPLLRGLVIKPDF